MFSIKQIFFQWYIEFLGMQEVFRVTRCSEFSGLAWKKRHLVQNYFPKISHLLILWVFLWCSINICVKGVEICQKRGFMRSSTKIQFSLQSGKIFLKKRSPWLFLIQRTNLLNMQISAILITPLSQFQVMLISHPVCPFLSKSAKVRLCKT